MTLIVHVPLGKRKRRPTKAQRELQAEWNQMLDKWKPKVMAKTYEQYRGDTYDDRGNRAIPSRGDGVGNAPLKESPRYSGKNVVGISIIHKSCLQPVFSKEAAIDAANMRR